MEQSLFQTCIACQYIEDIWYNFWEEVHAIDIKFRFKVAFGSTLLTLCIEMQHILLPINHFFIWPQWEKTSIQVLCLIKWWSSSSFLAEIWQGGCPYSLYCGHVFSIFYFNIFNDTCTNQFWHIFVQLKLHEI